MVCKDKEKNKINIFCLENMSFFPPYFHSQQHLDHFYSWGKMQTRDIFSRKRNIPFLLLFHTGEGSPSLSAYQFSKAKTSESSTLKSHKIKNNLWFLAWDCSAAFPSSQKSSYLISMLYTACCLSAGKIQSTKNAYCFESNNKMCACLQISYHCFFLQRMREI